MPVTVFEDAPLTGRWSKQTAPRDFLAACEHCLGVDRPDAVLTSGKDQVTAAVIAASKGRDIPVVYWLEGEPPRDLRFFHKVDYVIVGSGSERERLWNERGLAIHVLPDANTGETVEHYAHFFRSLWPQPGPPFMPRSNRKEHGETEKSESPASRERGDPRPDVVVMGLDNSGTTILTRMLHALGWQAGDADEEYAESVAARRVNIACLRTGRFPEKEAAEVLRSLPRPWALKDPRLVRTLHHWRKLMEEQRPMLVWIIRDREAVLASRRRRGAHDFQGLSYEQAMSSDQEQFDRWPWGKLRLRYEDLTQAAELFDPARARRA